MRLETDRLILRDWQDSDRPICAAMNADPVVRQYFHPHLKTADETNSMVDRMITGLAESGFGFLAVERKADGIFLGEIGLGPIDQLTKDAMIRPADVEIGWMFAEAHWGFGYAAEAGHAILDDAWQRLGLPEVIAFTYVGNRASQRVMEKLGMTPDAQPGFEDPTVPVGHWQRPHLLYRIVNPNRAIPA